MKFALWWEASGVAEELWQLWHQWVTAAWLQASLPISAGGLGIRSVSMLARSTWLTILRLQPHVICRTPFLAMTKSQLITGAYFLAACMLVRIFYNTPFKKFWPFWLLLGARMNAYDAEDWSVSHTGAQQTVKDEVIVRADFLWSFSSRSALNRENKRRSGGAKADLDDFLRNESIMCWLKNPDQAGDTQFRHNDRWNIVWIDRFDCLIHALSAFLGR